MYCYEVFHCEREECPVRLKNIKRCWTFFGENGTTSKEDCPYAPCSNCYYRMGWDIGLIGESLFAADQFNSSSDSIEELIPQNDESIPQQEPTNELLDSHKKQEASKLDLPEDIGSAGVRFCWEVMECPNPKCPVKERKIVRCFKFFEPKGDAKKLEITTGTRTCDKCHYRAGWELGIITESMFEDVLSEKHIKSAQLDSIKRRTLVEIYLQELAKKPLTAAEELALAKKIAGDRDAAELLLLANLKLVVRIAGNFTNRGLAMMDLIQEGNLGLIKAISKFDYTLGYKFSTYAAYWIKYYMQKAIGEQGRSIRIPQHLLTIAHKIQRKIKELESEFFRPPTLRELSQALALDEDKILEIIRITQTPISLETAKSENSDDDTTPEYYIADRSTLSPEEMAIEQAKAEACRKAIETLPQRQRDVVEMFYGFRDEVLSLAEIGRRLNISRERARQILKEAIRSLSEKEFVTNLKDFL